MSKRSNIMLAYPFEEKRLFKWKPPYIIQPKLDGERCRAVFDSKKWVLFSSENNTIISVPHIIEDLNNAYAEKIPIELDGELYTHGFTFEQIHSRVGRTTNIHPNFSDISYHIFDIINNEPQAKRLTTLKNNLKTQGSLKIVPFHLADSIENVLDIYAEILNNGYEGMVVRHFAASYLRRRSVYMMKFKPKKSDFYKICGYSIEVNKYKEPKPGVLGRLICAGSETDAKIIGEYPPIINPPDGYFSVGTGRKGTNNRLLEQMKLWRERETLTSKVCHVQYQHITPGKRIPRFPVFVEVIE